MSNEELRLWALDDDVTLAMSVGPDHVAHLVVTPSPAFQAQLDRIEAMLVKLVPGEKKEPPDLTFVSNYLHEVEPNCFIAGMVDVGDGTYIFRSRPGVSEDSQEWIKSQFRETIRFEVVA